MCNAWNHDAGCNCGWGGEGSTGGIGHVPNTPSISHPPPGTRSTWQHSESDCCAHSKCPRCGDAVFFVRHNGGSVYLDPPLGPPWPKHPCMDTSTSSYSSIKIIAAKVRQFPNMIFGIIVETIVDIPGRSGRVIVKCSDGTTLDEEIDSTVQFTKIIGSIIGVERTAYGIRFHLFPSTPRSRVTNKPVVPAWVEKCILELEDSSPATRSTAKTCLKGVHFNDLPAIYGILAATNSKSYLVRVGIQEALDFVAPRSIPILLLILHIPTCWQFEKLLEPYIGKSRQAARLEYRGILAIRDPARLRLRRWQPPTPYNIAAIKYTQQSVSPMRASKEIAFSTCAFCGAKLKTSNLEKHIRKLHTGAS